MGKHEPMSAKAIGIKIKAKGLQKIKYYCEMCKKQCRDDNGFKCHIQSESHQRQALIVAENPERFVGEFSQQFMDGFMYLVRTRFRSKRVLANTVFQEYIKERDHIHMNGTRWVTLTDFCNWLDQQGIVKAEESERGVMITYIDNDPDKLRRQNLEAKSLEREREAIERNKLESLKQMEATKKLIKDNIEIEKVPEPVPILIMPIKEIHSKDNNEKQTTNSYDESTKDVTSNNDVVEVPQFNFTPLIVKNITRSKYKPPPPKKRVSSKDIDAKKRPRVL